MSTLIYLVREKEYDDFRLIRAKSPAQVMRHLIKDKFTIERPTTADLADYLEAGASIERAETNDNEN